MSNTDAVSEYLRRPRTRGALYRPDRVAVGLSEAQRDRAAVVAAALAEWHRLAGEMANIGAFLTREGVKL